MIFYIEIALSFPFHFAHFSILNPNFTLPTFLTTSEFKNSNFQVFRKKASNFLRFLRIGFQLTFFSKSASNSQIFPNSASNFQLFTELASNFQLLTKLSSNFQLQYRNLGGDRPPPDRIFLQPWGAIYYAVSDAVVIFFFMSGFGSCYKIL